MKIGVSELPPRKPEDMDRMRAALRAVYMGRATSAQQKIAFSYIINDLCGLFGHTDAGLTADARAYSEGKRFVGIQLARLSEADLLTFRETSDDD